MKKLSKERLITLIIIFVVIIIAIFTLRKDYPETDEEISKCIGENSVLYSRLGCHFCEVQEEMFGENYKYLNTVDCFFEEEKCGNIISTPTWIINGKSHIGAQSFEKLKELTGC